MKLLVHPAIMAVFALYVFELPPLVAAVAILTAACPAGANVFVMARQYDLFLGRSASAVLISTALSVVTLSLLFAILKPTRSEEHTSELQSLMRISYAVFCLNKKKNITRHTNLN